MIHFVPTLHFLREDEHIYKNVFENVYFLHFLSLLENLTTNIAIVFAPRQQTTLDSLMKIKSKFYKKRGATFFYDITRKLGPLDFTQYMSKSSSF